MFLFSKEKDLIHRIANLILLLWLVIAIFVAYSNFINIVINEPSLTYEEYKNEECFYHKGYEEQENIDEQTFCTREYEQYKFYEKEKKYRNKKVFAISLGNIVIVGSFLFFLNKKRNFN